MVIVLSRSYRKTQYLLASSQNLGTKKEHQWSVQQATSIDREMSRMQILPQLTIPNSNCINLPISPASSLPALCTTIVLNQVHLEMKMTSHLHRQMNWLVSYVNLLLDINIINRNEGQGNLHKQNPSAAYVCASHIALIFLTLATKRLC